MEIDFNLGTLTSKQLLAMNPKQRIVHFADGTTDKLWHPYVYTEDQKTGNQICVGDEILSIKSYHKKNKHLFKVGSYLQGSSALVTDIKKRGEFIDVTTKQTVIEVGEDLEATEVLYGGAAGGGKATSQTTVIPTLTGNKIMRDVVVGDVVFDENGSPCNVVATTDLMYGRPCYRITFDNGQTIVVDEQHDWKTLTDSERTKNARRTPEYRKKRRESRESRSLGARPDLVARNKVKKHKCLEPLDHTRRSTKEIFETQKVRNRTNHSIDVCLPVEYPEKDFVIDPYVLGAWLGDGESRRQYIANPDFDNEIIDNIRDRGYKVTKMKTELMYKIEGLNEQLKKEGLIQNKHIPEKYMRGSIEQRLELVRGLLDTDGHCAPDGGWEFSQCSKNISESFCTLLASVGIKGTVNTTEAYLNGERKQDRHRVCFTTNIKVSNLKRKSDNQNKEVRPTQTRHYVVKVEKVESEPVKCIEVDSPSHLYLCTESYIPTHNSDAIRRKAIQMCLQIPFLNAYLFRRTSKDLAQNHLEGQTGFSALLQPLIDMPPLVINGKKVPICRITYKEPYVIRFYNGSVIRLASCQYDKDVNSYLGAEIGALFVDELTLFSEHIYRFLRGRCRVNEVVKESGRKVGVTLPFILCGTNPGSEGHLFVKKAFIDSADPYEIHKATKEQGGANRLFIPAMLDDNPYLDKEAYEQTLQGLGNPALIKAMLEGDWDIVAGGMFDDVWNKEIHVVKPFDVGKKKETRSWHIVRGMDWGVAKPYWVGWMAVCTEPTIVDGRLWYKGDTILVKELYGCAEDKNDVGLRHTPREVAKLVLEIDEEFDQEVYAGGTDSAIWAVHGSGSIADDFFDEGCYWTECKKGAGSRGRGFLNLRERLKLSIEGKEGGLYVMEGCSAVIRTLPVAPRDDKNQDVIHRNFEDHPCDGLSYLIATDYCHDMIITGSTI